ncbi:hypothetical protein V8C35DRAFT_280058 [Trichoderma chlorosporum]
MVWFPELSDVARSLYFLVGSLLAIMSLVMFLNPVTWIYNFFRNRRIEPDQAPDSRSAQWYELVDEFAVDSESEDEGTLLLL